MNILLKITTLTALLTLFKMGMGFLIAKAVAVYAGPSGMALLGQMQNVITTLNGIVNAPTGTCVVRYTAENISKGVDECVPWWRASICWAMGLLFIVIPIGIIESKFISKLLFKSDELSWLVSVALISLPISVLGNVVISVVNGEQKYKLYFKINATAVVVSGLAMLFLIFKFNIDGALFSSAVQFAIIGLVSISFAIKSPFFKFSYWFGYVSKYFLSQIGGYILMAITSALTLPLALIFIRNSLIDSVGLNATGEWQAVWKISEVYLGVITMTLSTYYIPKLSRLTNDIFLKEINKTAIIILFISILSAISVYMFRDMLIKILFTKDFYNARDYFFIQLCGDVIKVGSWIYAYPLVCRGMTKLVVLSEVLFALTFIVLGKILIIKYGVHGANIAYVLSYLVYFLFVCNFTIRVQKIENF